MFDLVVSFTCLQSARDWFHYFYNHIQLSLLLSSDMVKTLNLKKYAAVNLCCFLFLSAWIFGFVLMRQNNILDHIKYSSLGKLSLTLILLCYLFRDRDTSLAYFCFSYSLWKSFHFLYYLAACLSYSYMFFGFCVCFYKFDYLWKQVVTTNSPLVNLF